MKLTIFIDQMYWYDGEVYSSDEAYTLFVASFHRYFDEVILLGRLSPERGRKPYVLPPNVRVCPLPYYENVFAAWKAGPRLFRQVKEVVEHEAPNWDAVLIGGPNPVGNLVAKQCIALGRPLALLVRQNLIPQVRFGNRGVRRLLGVTFARYLEHQFRRMARNRVVFAVGEEMTKAYAAAGGLAYNHFACLVTDAQMKKFATMERKPHTNRLLFVGRLSSEKGFDYLLDAMADLRAAGHLCHLDIVGSGRIEAELRCQVVRLGLQEAITFHGYVEYGPELIEMYRRATALVVPSLSGEGFPQVINEALCIGVPTIATRVGGIPHFLKHEETALLIPAADKHALTQAMERMLSTPSLREHLRCKGQQLMMNYTLEANRDRMLQVIQEVLLPPDPHPMAAWAPSDLPEEILVP